MKEMKKALIWCLVLIIGVVVGKQEVLTAPTKLQIQHDFVSTELAERLYLELLKIIVPGPRDTMHERLIEINGDAGATKDLTPPEKAIRFREIIEEDSQEKESGILYIEKLKKVDIGVANELIRKVINNSVLDDEGTIHVYLSRPQSAALANHTDTTDIFVLQLHGTKEWILCDDPGHLALVKSLRGKLDGCSTYNEVEMDGLKCRRETLHPGDALYLPKRVVHSARATDEGLSAHLTFGFPDNKCLEDLRGCFDPATEGEEFMSQRKRRLVCNRSAGGTSCDFSCDSSCNTSSKWSCDGSCDTSCDTCPSKKPSGSPPIPISFPTPNFNPSPPYYNPTPTRPTSASTSNEGLNEVEISGIAIAVFISLVAVGVGVCFLIRARSFHAAQKQKEHAKKGEPVDTTVDARENQDHAAEVQNKVQPPIVEPTKNAEPVVTAVAQSPIVEPTKNAEPVVTAVDARDIHDHATGVQNKAQPPIIEPTKNAEPVDTTVDAREIHDHATGVQNKAQPPIIEPTWNTEPVDTTVDAREIQDHATGVQSKAEPPPFEKTIIKYNADGSLEVTKETKSSDGSMTKEIKMFPNSEIAKKNGY